MVPSLVSFLLLLSSVGEAEKIKRQWNPPGEVKFSAMQPSLPQHKPAWTGRGIQSSVIVANGHSAASGWCSKVPSE